MERIRLGTVSITSREKEYVNKVLDSGYVSPGRVTKEFEEQVADAHGKKYGLALNSGQSAIMIVLQAAKSLYNLKTIAVPAITYISSFSAAIQAGLSIKLVDVERTPEAPMRMDQVGTVFDAVLPCHLFGKANDYTGHESWQSKFVCDDACESIYAKGVAYGDATCLSFYPSHTITAGVGGMILTDDEDLYFKCWQLVNHGRSGWDNYTTCHDLKERFTFNEIGYSLKFSDLNAALGLAQHEQRKRILQLRYYNAGYLINALEDISDLHLPDRDGHTFMMFPMLVRSDRRDALEQALNDKHIETRRMMPITTQPVVRNMLGEHNMEHFPNANYINDHGFYFGCHQGLSRADLNRIVDTIKEFYGR